MSFALRGKASLKAEKSQDEARHIVVAKPGALGEGEDWLIDVGINNQCQQTFFTVFDALDSAAGPSRPSGGLRCFYGNLLAA